MQNKQGGFGAIKVIIIVIIVIIAIALIMAALSVIGYRHIITNSQSSATNETSQNQEPVIQATATPAK